jgi:DNA repair ATPase RecN
MTNPPPDRLDRVEEVLVQLSASSARHDAAISQIYDILGQVSTRLQQISIQQEQISIQQAANTQQIAGNSEGISELRLLLRDYFSRGGNGDRPPTT